MGESFSREKIKARTAEGRWMKNPVWPSSCVTPAGTSTWRPEWLGRKHTHTWGGVRCQTFLFFFFSFFPCSAGHERDWPPCKVVFFGLATNTLNVKNKNSIVLTFFPSDWGMLRRSRRVLIFLQVWSPYLGLLEAKHTCVIHGLARYSFVCFRSKRMDRCVWCWAWGVSGSRRPDIVRGDHTHLACFLLPCVIFHCSSSTSRWITVSCTFWITLKISTSWVLFVLVSMYWLRSNSLCNFILLLPCFMFFSLFFWCPCNAINVSVQYNGGLLPDIIILLTQCYYHRRTRLNAMKRFCICSLWSHLTVLTFFPPDWGMLRRSRRVLIFL